MLRRSSRCAFKAAVLLSGCGVYDGSEIHEATSVLIHLQRCGATKVDCFAPNAPQHHVINHRRGEIDPNATRNIAEESSRIFRGAVLDMEKLTPNLYDCLLLPGGFGAMKNLSDFAFVGAKGKIRPEVAWSLEAFCKAKKPIGAACIAPMLLTRVLPACQEELKCPKKLQITLGEATTGDFPDMARAFGAEVVKAKVTEKVVDADWKVVTTPAYMIEGVGPYDIFQGIGEMVAAVAQLCKK